MNIIGTDYNCIYPLFNITCAERSSLIIIKKNMAHPPKRPNPILTTSQESITLKITTKF
jgi:hypothetical protein